MIKGLIGLIESKTAITDVIGSDPMRLYGKVIPQGQSVFPCVVFRTHENQGTADFSGPSSYDMAMIDLWSYGRDYGQSNDLHEVLRTQLEASSGTFNGVEIDDVVYMTSGLDDYEKQTKYFTKHLEIKIAYRRLVSAN